MNKAFFILLFCFCNASPHAQSNLVYNGDFEVYDTCPVTCSSPGDMQIAHCLGWIAPTYGTSDYFNICSSGIVSVPHNFGGYQYPLSGNGYCGFYAFVPDGGAGCGYSGSYWIEYIQGRFIQPLQAGHIYQIGTHFAQSQLSFWSLDELGIYISTQPVSTCNTNFLPYTPQIKGADKFFFDDTLNWMPLSGYYLAQGGEKYLTIGNFQDSTDIDSVRAFGDPFTPYVYYYVDGMSTFDVTNQLCVPNIFSPNSDGTNDVWQLPFSSDQFEVLIFNRWGGELIRSALIDFFWDGTVNGSDCADGTYYYIIAPIDKSMESGQLKGFIQLVR